MIREIAIKYSQELLIADGHIDLPYRLFKENLLYEKNIDLDYVTQGNFDIPKAEKGGLNCPFMAIYIPADKSEKEAFNFANSLIDMVENVTNSNEKFDKALSPNDVINNFKNNKISLPMGMENGSALGNNFENLDYFFKRGIRYITLTHSKNNRICDSSYDKSERRGGLSNFGKTLIKKMNDIGMMIDVSHVSDDSFFDIIKISKKPIIASHSSPRHFTPNFERNLNDEMIKLIAVNNGVILVNFGSSFVNKKSNKLFNKINQLVAKWREENSSKISDEEVDNYRNLLIKKYDPFADIKDVLDSIDYIIDLVGEDYVGFGSDFDGLGNSLPNKLKDTSTYVNLIEGLLKRKHSKETIEKICYKNFFRVWGANLQNHQT